MENLSKGIREVAQKLFEDDRVDLIIGFEEGSLPLRATPCFIRNETEAERLIWNSSCENNLAVYLPKKKERIGIIAKGCDSRSIIVLLKERQIKRENLSIIGVPCQGMIDRKLIEKKLAGKEFSTIEEKPDAIFLNRDGIKEVIKKSDVLPESCKTCTHRNPVAYDILIGDKVEEQEEIDAFEKVKEWEAKSPDERWDYFTQETKKCIRCYACRNACPICYCEECCVDSTQPQWFGKSVELTDTQVFHIMRAFHTTGRCVDCGACMRACPMDVDLRFLNKKIEKDVSEFFSFEAGIDLEECPPLATFKPDDPEEFIK